MYTGQLATFVCVADSGSFHGAAKKMLISTPAVMKQINTLEARLELKLVERSTRGVRLTAAGEAIYKDAQFIFEYSKKAVENARQLMETAEKKIAKRLKS
jgi:molybdate transport repressor ModE-like protein